MKRNTVNCPSCPSCNARLSITSMKAQRTKVARATNGRIVVKRPSTLKDYKRIYKIKNGVLWKARKLEKLLSVAA